MAIDTNLLKKLTEAIGVSGFEDDVVKIILDEFSDYHKDFIHVDSFNNVVIRKCGKAGAPTIAFFAHIDEVGFLISDITDDGFLKFKNIGGLNRSTLDSAKVQIKIDSKIFRPHEGIIRKNGDNDFYIDVGASSKKDVYKKLIHVNGIGTFDTKFDKLKKDIFVGKALDNRVSVYALIEAMKQIANLSCENNIVAVFTSQEEVGCRGAEMVAKWLKPDIAFVLDTTDSFDVPELPKFDCKIGNGPTLNVMDGGTIAHNGLLEYTKYLFRRNNIEVVYDPMAVGATDNSKVQLSNGGVPSLTISTPVRYMHTPHSIGSLSDIEKLIDIIVLLSKSITIQDLDAIKEYKYK